MNFDINQIERELLKDIRKIKNVDIIDIIKSFCRELVINNIIDSWYISYDHLKDYEKLDKLILSDNYGKCYYINLKDIDIRIKKLKISELKKYN